MSKQLKEFQEYLVNAKRVVAVVGAGLSVSSGLPIFRGSQGLWKNFNMIDLATPDAFYIDPGLVWQFYSCRRANAIKARPNEGHRALAKLSKCRKIEYLTINQNIDGLLTRAGHSKDNLQNIHGSLFDLQCTSFMCNYVDNDNFDIPLTKALADSEFEYQKGARKRSIGEEINPMSPQFTPVKQIAEKDLPQCPICKDGSILRPGVVWFGESLPLNSINTIDNFIEQDEKVDLVLVIGTSGTVYPANSYVERIRYKGGKVAIFNTDIESNVLNGEVEGTWGFLGDAAETLPVALGPLLDDDRGPGDSTF